MNKKKKMGLAAVIAVGVLLIPLFLYFNVMAKEPMTPTETITTYYEHAKNGNIEDAKELVSQEVISQYEKGGTWFAGSLKSAIVKEGKEYKKVIPKDESITGESANVKVMVTDQLNKNFMESYILVKEDGNWKITFQ